MVRAKVPALAAIGAVVGYGEGGRPLNALAWQSEGFYFSCSSRAWRLGSASPEREEAGSGGCAGQPLRVLLVRGLPREWN